MSNIRRARELLAEARKWTAQAETTMTQAWSEFRTADEYVDHALRLMYREGSRAQRRARLKEAREAAVGQQNPEQTEVIT